MKSIKIIKSEAWVDTMPVQPTHGGTLHVVVEFNGDGRRGSLTKKIPQGINPAILLLDLNFSENRELVPNPQKVEYTEGLQKSNQYTSIEIFIQDSGISITDIPIIK